MAGCIDGEKTLKCQRKKFFFFGNIFIGKTVSTCTEQRIASVDDLNFNKKICDRASKTLLKRTQGNSGDRIKHSKIIQVLL